MKLTIIGSGKMGEALVRGMLRAGAVAAADVTLTDVDGTRLVQLAVDLGAVAGVNNADAVREADVVVLAVKPNLIEEVCNEVSDALRAGVIVISIAAGVTLRQINQALNRHDITLVRAMPNTPCLVGAGAIGVSVQEQGAGIPDSVYRTITRLLSPVGMVEFFSERLLDAVTGLSGSGPAYIAVLIEAMADGGVLMGLPRAVAQRFAAQTILGTARLVQETGQHPAQVKDAVSSPGGTTIAGIAALEEHGFRAAIIAAIGAATRRSRELSGE